MNNLKQLWNENLLFVGQEKEVVAVLSGSSLTLLPKYESLPDQAIVAASPPADQIHVRFLTLPVSRKKELEALLPFQADPLFPYSQEQGILAYQILEKREQETDLILFGMHIDDQNAFLQNHPSLDHLFAPQMALAAFGKKFIAIEQPYLLFHLKEKILTALFLHKERVQGAFAQRMNELTPDALQATIHKMGLALAKITSLKDPLGAVLTGELTDLSFSLPFQELFLENPSWRKAAVAIGLAELAACAQPSWDFLQKRFPPWKRLWKPLVAYGTGIFSFSLALYLFTMSLSVVQTETLRKEYAQLLSDLGRSPDQIEKAMHGQDVSPIPWQVLSQEEIEARLFFLANELEKAPHSFSLFPNIPRVSDFLGWLSTHPAIVSQENGGKLQIEHLSYLLVKRPTDAKKLDPYQIKVEIDFTAPQPKWAREFHDALITPNPWVDQRAEIKWNASHGRYQTSFFLKTSPPAR